MDLIGREGNNLWVAVSSGASFATTQWATNVSAFADTVFRDFNGDGKADLAGRLSSGEWYVFQSAGIGFGPGNVWSVWGVTNWRDVKGGDLLP